MSLRDIVMFGICKLQLDYYSFLENIPCTSVCVCVCVCCWEFEKEGYNSFTRINPKVLNVTL